MKPAGFWKPLSQLKTGVKPSAVVGVGEALVAGQGGGGGGAFGLKWTAVKSLLAPAEAENGTGRERSVRAWEKTIAAPRRNGGLTVRGQF